MVLYRNIVWICLGQKQKLKRSEISPWDTLVLAYNIITCDLISGVMSAVLSQWGGGASGYTLTVQRISCMLSILSLFARFFQFRHRGLRRLDPEIVMSAVSLRSSIVSSSSI